MTVETKKKTKKRATGTKKRMTTAKMTKLSKRTQMKLRISIWKPLKR